ncbi:MAG: toll/interleukin-1 receptor domain-containing protein [Nitrososphaerales archaeon]
MGYDKIFISYSVKDRTLIQPILEALQHIFDVCISEDKNNAGEALAGKVESDIESSNVIVPFLTLNSLASQWVNQEIGYAYRLRKENGGEPLILPVAEAGVSPSGFLTKKETEFIPLYSDDSNETAYQLVKRLREYVDRNYTVVDTVRVVCKKCDYVFSIDLLSQSKIDDAIRTKRVIPAICERCKTMNELSPKTFSIVRQVSYV